MAPSSSPLHHSPFIIAPSSWPLHHRPLRPAGAENLDTEKMMQMILETMLSKTEGSDSAAIEQIVKSATLGLQMGMMLSQNVQNGLA